MKKLIIFLFILTVVVTGILLAQKKVEIEYDAQWKKIEELAAKQLPESALKETELILKKAMDEKNVQQLIKATVYKMRFTLQKEPEKSPKLIKEFETFTEKTTDKTDKALLNSMLAELYANFYQANQWNIEERTEVHGTVPDDIKEWTKNIFYDKVMALLDASLLNTELLQKTDVTKYELLLEKGDDSKVLQPTLYDFLAQRKIDILESLEDIVAIENPLDDAKYYLPAKEFVKIIPDEEFQQSLENKILAVFQQLISFHFDDKQPDALIYFDLQRLDYVNAKSNDKKAYLKALENMERQFKSFPAVIEVIADLASYYHGLNVDEENADFDKSALRTAYDICADGIKRFPEYKRINLLKNIQSEISRKKLSYNHNGVCLPSSKLDLNISFANIDEAELKVYKLDVSAIDYYTYKQNSRNDRTLHPSAKLIVTRKIALKKDKNFLSKDTEISVSVGDYGIYELSLAAPNETNKEQIAYSSFTVSSLSYIMRKTEPEKLSLYALNRKSGLQISDVTVKTGALKWNGKKYDFEQKLSAKTNKSGFCAIPIKNEYTNDVYFFESGNDKYFSSQNYQYYQSYASGHENQRPQLTILTDRSLYRPGQTVYFKGISYFSSKNKQEVNKNASYEVTLLDANYQKVSSKKFKTNEFGSFAGEFVLPAQGLNGQFTLNAEGGAQTIWVEEYKRPTFEVKIPKPVAEIRFGDNVTVKGNVKAFAGYDIANAKVKYRVMQQPHFFCWWLNRQTKELSSGSLVTDADGNFEINFTPEKPKDMIIGWRANVYTYVVSADVTQQNGETQQGEMSFSIGDKALFIIATIADKIEKSAKLSIPVSAETLNGERVSTSVSYSFFRLEESGKFIESNTDFDSLKVTAKVIAGTVKVPDNKITLDARKWESGVYRMVLTAKDKFGADVKTEYNFVLFAKTDKKTAYKTYEWLSTEKTKCEPGENAVVRFGTSTKNTMVLYELMQGNIVLDSKWIKFNDEIKTFKIPFLETYGEGVNVQFTFMKDEKLFTKQISISKKIIKKQITPKFSVFRDKLQPGQYETWTVTIPGTEKNAAELLAAMYDASLDMIRPHSWYFSPDYRPFVPNSQGWSSGYDNDEGGGVSYNVQFGDIPEFKLNHLNWFGLIIEEYYSHRRRFKGVMYDMVMEEDAVAMDVSIPETRVDMRGDISNNSELPPPPPPSSELNEVVTAYGYSKTTVQKSSQVKPRTNFAETAFFYPQLKTDAQGNVKFSFTAPESLTRWNVKLLAHTPDLYYGSFDTMAVTQKDVMVQMNLPRFVRRSDKLMLNATVINLSDKDLQAKVTFDLIDPATEKEIELKAASVKNITLKAAETKVVEWEINEFSDYEIVICKIIAEAGNFSDGEQKYLPVLPDKVLITESLPLTIRGNQTRTFNFESLMKNASNVDNKNLTIEFSSNPAWYAVQALPTLSAPENDNALDLFTAYYVNSLAGFIANSNPKIAKIFDQWKNAKGGRDALLSNLQQNAELKNMLLEETPWVMAAKDETEQKRQIALLFDLNMQKNQAQQYLDKLLKLQQPDGGFTWFEGMPSSRYITQEILMNFARLNKMIGGNMLASYSLPLTAALNYLDLEISRDFAMLKKYNKNYQKENCIGNIQLFYLHTRSEYPEIPVADFAKDAVSYYTTQSEKYWTSFTLYGKAMMAMVANRNGKSRIANEILKSLKENALKTDEFGMYWAKNTAGYFWNERPVAVQAAIIEAFTEISKNASEIDELKIWLLKQKQTQRWDSPVASVNAIYALLLQGNDWLATDGKVKISAGNKLITPAKVEAGTGYFKETIPMNEIRPQTGKITVEKTDKNIGWGAVYWQYFQEHDKVQNSAAGLKITKKLFVKEGSKMTPFEQVQVKKGDKIVTRLVISTDRNLEYVALKDLRAACFEPVDHRSGCLWKESVCYYQTIKDASTQFFFSFLPKGTYVFEYELWANNTGTFTSGIASVQCQYAPEFVSYAGGEKIKVRK